MTLEKEAEEDVLPADLNQLVASASDPLSQILAAQLQQNQLLMQRLLPKQQDPVLGTLASSDNASGSGSNVKGCLAREAFQRTIQDLQRVAMLVQMNAMKELGFGPDRVDSSLMRRYVERRIPLQELPSVLGCYNAGRELGDWLRCSRQAADGFDFQDAAVCRADSSRWGQDPTELAPVWIPRTCESSSHVVTQEAGPGAFCQTLSSSVGSGKPELPSGFGLHGDSHGSVREAQSLQSCPVGRGERSKTKSKSNSQSQGPREGWRQADCRARRDSSHGVTEGLQGTKPSKFPKGTNAVNDPFPPSPPKESPFVDQCRNGHFAELRFDPIKLMQVLCDEFWRCPTGLTYYAKASLTSSSCTVHGAKPGPLWPVPPLQVAMHGILETQS